VNDLTTQTFETIHHTMRKNKLKAAKILNMRKAILAAIVLALFVIASACNKHSCPAYSQNDTEQTETNS
jgi:hypothetical protein